MNTPINFRVGEGWDVHALVPGRPLVIGGVTIPHPVGLLGHSDADVLLHAITDALLGAAALGDIGRHFPDTDAQFRGADSIVSSFIFNPNTTCTIDTRGASSTKERDAMSTVVGECSDQARSIH